MKIGKKSLLIKYQEGYIKMGTLLQTYYENKYNICIYPKIFWRCALDHTAGQEYTMIFGNVAPMYKHLGINTLRVVCMRLSQYYKHRNILVKDMGASNHYRKHYKDKTLLIDENIIEKLLPF